MVLGRVLIKGAEIGIKYGTRFVKSDKVAWNKLYTGFPNYVKKGTRQGFIVGSSVGGLLSGVTDLSDNGVTDINGVQKRPKSYPNKQNQARNRYGRGSNSRYSGRYTNRRHCDCSKFNFRTRRSTSRRYN